MAKYFPSKINKVSESSGKHGDNMPNWKSIQPIALQIS